MTSTIQVDLKRQYTPEERDALFESYIQALERNDNAEADRILEQMPIHPRWAKIIAEVLGRDVLEENFNITEANRVFGEDWLDG